MKKLEQEINNSFRLAQIYCKDSVHKKKEIKSLCMSIKRIKTISNDYVTKVEEIEEQHKIKEKSLKRQIDIMVCFSFVLLLITIYLITGVYL